MYGVEEQMDSNLSQVQSETQTALSRIWTRVTDSISYDDNHYAKCFDLWLRNH